MAENRPQVGIGVMIFNENSEVLLTKRKGSHGAGEFAFPGGHLEFGESFSDCAMRETTEEAGIEISNVQFQYLANILKYGGKHYVHIGLTAVWKSGEPQILEPEKSEDWGWYSLDNPPEPLFEMCTLAIKSYKSGQNYYDFAEQSQ
jgi:8-oxo-dGTP diphosphatase